MIIRIETYTHMRVLKYVNNTFTYLYIKLVDRERLLHVLSMWQSEISDFATKLIFMRRSSYEKVFNIIDDVRSDGVCGAIGGGKIK